MDMQENIALAPLTTMGVGGRARFFCTCATEEEIREALELSLIHISEPTRPY